jgi:hypothetical protein
MTGEQGREIYNKYEEEPLKIILDEFLLKYAKIFHSRVDKNNC